MRGDKTPQPSNHEVVEYYSELYFVLSGSYLFVHQYSFNIQPFSGLLVLFFCTHPELHSGLWMLKSFGLLWFLYIN
jgi:hypothetical protein